MDEGMRVKEGENTMGNYTREEVLQMAEDEDVEFIRLQFTDMFGTLKNIAITARELPRALDLSLIHIYWCHVLWFHFSGST